MTQEQGSTTSGKRIIGERFSTRAIEALMSNYRDAQQAFLDLIDNAIDNRIEGKQLLVRVTVAKNQLAIYNQGGEGLDYKGLENYFVWGYSEKVGRIGHYGVGGKAAMGFLARSMEVSCSGNGSDREFKVSDQNWETREEEFKQFEVEERKAPTPEGYFRVRLTNLKRDVNASALASKLGDIYRPLLLDRSIIILVNGKEVQPLEIKYLESDPNLLPQPYRVHTRLGDTFVIKVGVLEEGQRVKPGIRCYYRGRLIEDEQFFGRPTPALMPQASRLIGEADLDFVDVTSNKSNFVRDSVKWDMAARRISEVLAPWYTKLSKLRIEQRSPVESYERELLRKAKRVVEHVLATSLIITKRDLSGGSGGRLPPTPRGESRPHVTGGGSGARAREGQTAPTLAATVGEETIKRWGAFHAWETVSMGVVDKRAEIVEENGRLVLKINSDYPFYQAAKRAGEEALEIFMAETAVMKICEVVAKDRSVDEYVELRDQCLSRCGEVYSSVIRRSDRTRRTKR